MRVYDTRLGLLPTPHLVQSLLVWPNIQAVNYFTGKCANISDKGAISPYSLLFVLRSHLFDLQSIDLFMYPPTVSVLPVLTTYIHGSYC